MAFLVVKLAFIAYIFIVYQVIIWGNKCDPYSNCHTKLHYDVSG